MRGGPCERLRTCWVWSTERAHTDAHLRPFADVDFYIDNEMAHVADFSTSRKHSDYFVKQIIKLEEIIANLK